MALKKFSFNVEEKDNQARLGLIKTHRGNINTPAFMPVGTQATIKGTFIEDIIKTGSEIILSNTYHLMIRPGADRIQSSGGLHQFMNCKLPILTDSGGFQVMSLSKLNKIDREKGAIFNSHIDGKKFILSPEESIRVQKSLNSDIVMVMDECPKKSHDFKKINKSMDLSMYWAERSKKAFGKNPHKGIFGIVQGGLFKDLRIKSLEQLIDIDFDGYAVGGLAVGESQNEMFKVLDDITYLMPNDKPRYLMGVGTPSDILGAVKRGIDMFDCVLPTRSGRTGLAFTWNGRINIRNSKYQHDNKPIDIKTNKLLLRLFYTRTRKKHSHFAITTQQNGGGTTRIDPNKVCFSCFRIPTLLAGLTPGVIHAFAEGRRGELTPVSAMVSFLGLDRLLPRLRNLHYENEPVADGVMDVPVVSGAALMVPRRRFLDHGGFDERYFLHVEDIDLCRQVRAAGGRVYFEPRAEILHYGGTSQTSPFFVETHKALGFIKYFWKHYPGPIERLATMAMIAPIFGAICDDNPKIESMRKIAGDITPHSLVSGV